jgi:hypothetical protein
MFLIEKNDIKNRERLGYSKCNYLLRGRDYIYLNGTNPSKKCAVGSDW